MLLLNSILRSCDLFVENPATEVKDVQSPEGLPVYVVRPSRARRAHDRSTPLIL
jgi:hypothetical protein